jgi:hypothetical protein
MSLRGETINQLGASSDQELTHGDNKGSPSRSKPHRDLVSNKFLGM